MRPIPVLLASAAALALAAGTGRAQTREGFYVGAGAGWGSARMTADIVCHDCRSFDFDRAGSLTAHLRLGTSINPHFALGAELSGWFQQQTNDVFEVRTRLYNASLAFSVYPGERGFFLKLGPGFSRAEIHEGHLGATFSGSGFGFTAGVGYDIPVGHAAALTPLANYWWGKPGDLGGGVDVGQKHNVLELALGLSFY